MRELRSDLIHVMYGYDLDDTKRIESREQTEQERLDDIAARAETYYQNNELLVEFIIERAEEIAEVLKTEKIPVLDEMHKKYCNEVAGK